MIVAIDFYQISCSLKFLVVNSIEECHQYNLIVASLLALQLPDLAPIFPSQQGRLSTLYQ